jgi:hypothetical protein
MAGVWIGARNHIHAQFSAAMGHVAESVHVSQPLAPVVQRDLRWIERHASAGIQDRGIGMDASKEIQPELHVVIAGIVFDEAQLSPPHRPVIPRGVDRFDHRTRRRHGLRVRHPVYPGKAGS